MCDIRRNLKPVSCLLILAMLNMSLMQRPIYAAMVSTDAVIGETAQSDLDRTAVREFLLRDDVRQELKDQGVDPEEVLARVDALSDREVRQIAERIDDLPAAGALGGDEIILGGGVILLLGILIILVYAGVIFLVVKIME